MIIPPNENGWSYDDSVGNWKLVHADKIIVLYEQTDQSIATQSALFVGTEQECEAEIIRLNLPWASVSPVVEENIEPAVATETVYKLIHDGTHILWFSVDVDYSNVEGTTVVGTQEECEAEITRLGLTWPYSDDSETEITEEVSLYDY